MGHPKVENPLWKNAGWGPGSFSMGFSASPNVLKHWQTLQEFQTKSNV